MTVFGHNPESVIHEIQNRLAMLQIGGTASKTKLALVVEGGGMRSASTGAGVQVLSHLGLSGVFDEVFATSAGVMNASYFLTDQVELGMSVYYENCTTRMFMNPLRFWKIIDVDYIVDRVVVQEKVLNLEKLARSPSHLFVAACDYHSGQPVLIDTRATRSPILEVMRAAMALPLFYNRAIDIDGVPCIDGGTILPIVLDQAIERGCTHILVLLSRPSEFMEESPSWKLQQAFKLRYPHRRKLCEAFANRQERSHYLRSLALGRFSPPAGVNIATICPSAEMSIESTTFNAQKMRAAARDFAMNLLSIFRKISPISVSKLTSCDLYDI